MSKNYLKSFVITFTVTDANYGLKHVIEFKAKSRAEALKQVPERVYTGLSEVFDYRRAQSFLADLDDDDVELMQVSHSERVPIDGAEFKSFCAELDTKLGGGKGRAGDMVSMADAFDIFSHYGRVLEQCVDGDQMCVRLDSGLVTDKDFERLRDLGWISTGDYFVKVIGKSTGDRCDD